jgi:ATP-dependent exoDNAse (exonuclease V) alpha subunit
MSDIIFSKKQDEFYQAVLNRESVFLDGKAGTGKTFVVKEVIKELENYGLNVIMVAPTGIASNNLGGATIHSTFSLTPFGVLNFEKCNFMKSVKRDVLKKTDIIVIDEVSMLRPDVLDAMNWTLIKNGIKPLNEYQIIFVGDMKQLGIIADDNMLSVLLREYNGFDFFKAKIYQKMNLRKIELDEIQRQSDEDFINALNLIRDDKKSPYFRRFISKEIKGVVLAPHNSTVQKYNEEGLKKLNSQTINFRATIDGNVKEGDFNVDLDLNLKSGCKVIYLVNSKNNDLYNGSLGTFIEENGRYFIEIKKERYAIEERKFTKKEYVLDEDSGKLELKEIGSIIQIPLKLAYALSIHKSQGLTFEECTVDLSRPCFAKGQLYVALSRVKGPDGLSIIV